MSLILDAACLCHTGRLRKNNEDNFYFNGRCLEAEHSGLRQPEVMAAPLTKEICLALFDGMGGESYGELASFAAASRLQTYSRKLSDYFIPARKFLKDLSRELNGAVVEQKASLHTEHMGSTMAACFFTRTDVYICNVGDSRAYRLREGEFLQLSKDHVERLPEGSRGKAPLTQYLGLDPEELRLEPYIAKGDLRHGDMYLLCSDGLTDMLSNLEIADILHRAESMEHCVQELVDQALEHGGRDNVTVIACRIL